MVQYNGAGLIESVGCCSVISARQLKVCHVPRSLCSAVAVEAVPAKDGAGQCRVTAKAAGTVLLWLQHQVLPQVTQTKGISTCTARLVCS